MVEPELSIPKISVEFIEEVGSYVAEQLVASSCLLKDTSKEEVVNVGVNEPSKSEFKQVLNTIPARKVSLSGPNSEAIVLVNVFNALQCRYI